MQTTPMTIEHIALLNPDGEITLVVRSRALIPCMAFHSTGYDVAALVKMGWSFEPVKVSRMDEVEGGVQ